MVIVSPIQGSGYDSMLQGAEQSSVYCVVNLVIRIFTFLPQRRRADRTSPQRSSGNQNRLADEMSLLLHSLTLGANAVRMPVQHAAFLLQSSKLNLTESMTIFNQSMHIACDCDVSPDPAVTRRYAVGKKSMWRVQCLGAKRSGGMRTSKL